MKSLPSKLGVILIGLAIFANAEARGAEWRLYYFDETCSCLYDEQNITRPSRNIVMVWTKCIYTKKGVMDWVIKFGETYANLDDSIDLSAIDCIEKTFRMLSLTHYDNKGGTIYSTSSPSEWKFIIPESIGERLHKEICK
jgi:hypothetical protein